MKHFDKVVESVLNEKRSWDEEDAFEAEVKAKVEKKGGVLNPDPYHNVIQSKDKKTLYMFDNIQDFFGGNKVDIVVTLPKLGNASSKEKYSLNDILKAL